MSNHFDLSINKSDAELILLRLAAHLTPNILYWSLKIEKSKRKTYAFYHRKYKKKLVTAMQLIEHLPTMHKALDLIPSISQQRSWRDDTRGFCRGQSSWLTRPAALALQEVWCPLLTQPHTLKLKKRFKKNNTTNQDGCSRNRQKATWTYHWVS